MTKSVVKAAGKEAAETAARNSASHAGQELTHLTTPAAKEAIEDSGKIGGKWGLFALESAKVPSSQAARTATTLVPRTLSGEIKISTEASSVFSRPPRFGLFSGSRYYSGVRASPLGSLNLRTGEFAAGEIFKGGTFRAATRGEYGLQVGHQWLLDYGIDSLMYTGIKAAGATHRLEDPTTPPVFFNFEF